MIEPKRINRERRRKIDENPLDQTLTNHMARERTHAIFSDIFSRNFFLFIHSHIHRYTRTHIDSDTHANRNGLLYYTNYVLQFRTSPVHIHTFYGKGRFVDFLFFLFFLFENPDGARFLLAMVPGFCLQIFESICSHHSCCLLPHSFTSYFTSFMHLT